MVANTNKQVSSKEQPDKVKEEKKEKKEEKKEDQKGAVSDGSKKPESHLAVDPDTGYFNPGGGTTMHMLVNTSNRRMAVKIRSSNNDLYRVHPAAMLIDPGQCQCISVTRTAGPARPDKLVIQATVCGEEEKDPKEFYKNLEKKEDKNDKAETLRINLRMADQKPKTYTSIELCE